MTKLESDKEAPASEEAPGTAAAAAAAPPNPYESPRLLAEYLVLHYGGEREVLDGMPGPVEALGFPVRCVTELLDAEALPDRAAALDLGCAVGRSAFELARWCRRVVGIDFSASFVAAARRLALSGEHPYDRAIEGEITDRQVARVPAGIDRSRVVFETGDAAALRSDLRDFDVVLAANLVCRLGDPAAFVDRLESLVKPGGQLLLTTPFTWTEEFTPRDRWLGGRAGGPRSVDALRARLEPDFELRVTRELPFFIREHARKFQYGVALGTRWVRRPAAPASSGYR